MTLENFLNEKRLKKHMASHEEIINLFKVVDRDIKDANIKELSADRRFITSYNAALQLATILLRAFGYRTNANKGGHHWVTFSMLGVILDDDSYADYFEACRVKRNVSDYDSSGAISEKEAEELLQEVLSFKSVVENWLDENFQITTGSV